MYWFIRHRQIFSPFGHFGHTFERKGKTYFLAKLDLASLLLDCHAAASGKMLQLQIQIHASVHSWSTSTVNDCCREYHGSQYYRLVFWPLVSLQSHGSVTQTGLPGSYVVSHWYLKQHPELFSVSMSANPLIQSGTLLPLVSLKLMDIISFADVVCILQLGSYFLLLSQY